MNDWLESEAFYNAMQGYRCASATDQREVFAHFENVKRLVRQNASASPAAIGATEDDAGRLARCTASLLIALGRLECAQLTLTLMEGAERATRLRLELEQAQLELSRCRRAAMVAIDLHRGRAGRALATQGQGAT